MLLHLGFIDRDAQTGPGVGPNDAPLFLDREPFLNDILPPRHIGVNGLADDIARLRKTELQRRGGADRALRIVGRQRDAMCFRAARLARYPGADTLEESLEVAEGLAEYTGTRVEQSTREIEEMNEMFMAREEKILELKEEIRRLRGDSKENI